VIYAAFKLYV